MDVSTIIVSYNTFELTTQAVRTALAAAGPLRHEVIVIDNASPDASASRLAREFPKGSFPNVSIIGNKSNLGFSAANNQAARSARGSVLFFLNPDTIVHDLAIAVLFDFLASHPRAGAVGPHVLNADGSDQLSSSPFFSAGWMLRHYLPLGSLIRGMDRRHDEVPAATQEVDVVNGCALAIRNEVFQEIGGWDQSYFMYAEETELCYALVKAGYTNYFVREAVVTHLGGASSLQNYAEQQIVHAKSMVQFIARHHPNLLLMHRILGIVGFGARAAFFSVLSISPSSGEETRRRAEAARALFRWFLLRKAAS